jgi:hypothetical protein
MADMGKFGTRWRAGKGEKRYGRRNEGNDVENEVLKSGGRGVA